MYHIQDFCVMSYDWW